MPKNILHKLAGKRKLDKYTKIKSSKYVFKALKFETVGLWTEEPLDLINRFGTLLTKKSGDLQVYQFLNERLPHAIQRGSSTSIILGTLPNSIPMD